MSDIYNVVESFRSSYIFVSTSLIRESSRPFRGRGRGAGCRALRVSSFDRADPRRSQQFLAIGRIEQSCSLILYSAVTRIELHGGVLPVHMVTLQKRSNDADVDAETPVSAGKMSDRFHRLPEPVSDIWRVISFIMTYLFYVPDTRSSRQFVDGAEVPAVARSASAPFDRADPRRSQQFLGDDAGARIEQSGSCDPKNALNTMMMSFSSSRLCRRCCGGRPSAHSLALTPGSIRHLVLRWLDRRPASVSKSDIIGGHRIQRFLSVGMATLCQGDNHPIMFVDPYMATKT